jgi:hypothetical protein
MADDEALAVRPFVVTDRSLFCTCTRPSYCLDIDPKSDYTGLWICGSCRKPSKAILEGAINS